MIVDTDAIRRKFERNLNYYEAYHKSYYEGFRQGMQEGYQIGVCNFMMKTEKNLRDAGISEDMIQKMMDFLSKKYLRPLTEQEVKKYYHEKFRNCDVENLGRN